MSNADTDKIFSGSVSKLYEAHLVPLIFEPYATDLVNRLGEATDIAAAAITQRFGWGAVDGKIQAHVVTIEN